MIDILSTYVELSFSTSDDASYKFGYYNYCPLSRDNNKLLAHRFLFEGRPVRKEDHIEIGYFDLLNNKWVCISTTSAFNWQQCSMLQWLGPDFNTRIIFNDADITANKFISKIIDINTLEEKVISRAIYAVDPLGKFSISLNFERSFFTRAYSYVSVIDQSWNELIPEKDAILYVDLEKNTSHELINIKSLIKDYSKVEDWRDYSHWFEHIMLNPSGNRFAFYHRFGNNLNYETRCLTANVDGSEIWLQKLSNNESISHLGWLDDFVYYIFTYVQSKISTTWVGENIKPIKSKWYITFYRKYIKRFVPRFFLMITLPDSKSFYVKIIDKHGTGGKLKLSPINLDGHPSFTKDRKHMLTDTYPDKNGYRNLLLYNLELDKTIILGRFSSFYNNCDWRADLHPRFSDDNNKIVIDTNNNGFHKIIVLDIKWDEIKKILY
jgi:hypothetical protein